MSIGANALTTLAQVKAAAPAPCADARLEFLVDEVSALIERYTGRSLGLAVVTEDNPDCYQGGGTIELPLRRLPIITVTRVRVYLAQVSDWFRMPHGDAQGILFRGARSMEYAWERGDAIWPHDLTRDRNTMEDSRSWNVDVCGTFGFVLPQYAGAVNAAHNPSGGPQTLPRDIEGACIREVLRRAYRPVPGLSSEKTPGAWELQWAEQSNSWGFADETIAALSPYCLPSRWFA